MGIRETISKNPQIVTSITLVMIGVALLGMGVQLVCSPVPNGGQPELAYYTTDDGRTFFSDVADRVPPFDHAGRPAVRAVVFTCDDGKTRFAGYLQRYSDTAHAALRQRPTTPANQGDFRRYGILAQGLELKRPGDPEWTPQSFTERHQAIVSVTCPDGTSARLIAVVPPDPAK